MYGVLDPAHAASVSSASDGTALSDNFPLPFGSGTFLSPELTRSKLGRSLILADRWPGVAPKLPGGKREEGRGKGDANGQDQLLGWFMKVLVTGGTGVI